MLYIMLYMYTLDRATDSFDGDINTDGNGSGDFWVVKISENKKQG